MIDGRYMWLATVVPLAVGCSESVTVVGNGIWALVACALLWSTVNLGGGTSE